MSDITDAERYAWLVENAHVQWALYYKNVVVTFALDSENFDNLSDAVDQAMAEQS